MSNKKIIFSGFMAALLLATGANAAEIASKGYVDNRESAVKSWVGTQDYATATELTTGLATKADADTTYTKTEVDDAIAGIDTTIPDGSVTKAKLDTAVQGSLDKADTALQTIADGSVTEAKLSTTVNASLDKADTAVQADELGALATKDTIVTADITDANVTKAKLAADVQTSLGKADSALQAAAIADLATKTELAAKANTADLGDLAAKDTIATADIDDAAVTAAKLAAPIVTSLGKADTALQAAAIADMATKTELAAKANTADLGDLAAKDTIATADIEDAAVTAAKLAAPIVTSLGKADTALQAIADGSVTEAKLSSTVNASLDKADSAVQTADLDPYAKTAAVLPKPGANCLATGTQCVLSVNKTDGTVYWAEVVE